MTIFHDLMKNLQNKQHSTYLDAGEMDDIWYQHSGQTLIRTQAPDSPDQGIQDGKTRYCSTKPATTTAVRMATRQVFGPNIDVFGWFRVFEWFDSPGDNHGVKLYTSFEDNNANNTISLLKKGNTPSWYMEDRVGLYPNTDTASGENQTSGLSIPMVQTELNYRHRFLWSQRVEDGGLRGTLWVDGVLMFNVLNPEPLYVGHIGWRLDKTGTDWFIGIYEH